MRHFSLGLFVAGCICFLAACPRDYERQPVPKDNTTLVVYSRHTFRGISKSVGPQQITLSEYGINIPAPILSYAEDATPRGLEIATDYASLGIQGAAALAVDALGEGRVFDGRWDELRADLSTERTFWTAMHLRDGLVWYDPDVNQGTIVTGCPTQPDTAIDVVSSHSVVEACVPNSVLQPLLVASPDLPALKARGEDLLNAVRSGIGATGSKAVLADAVYSGSNLPSAYSQVANLASIVEMIAPLGPPLLALFDNVPKRPLVQYGRAAVRAGLNTLGINFFVGIPDQMGDAIATWPVQFINSRPTGSHTIVVSHDDFLSALARSLGIISRESDPSDLAMYPIESFIFAIGDSSVSVVRMRILTEDPSGFIPGPYGYKLVWKGSKADWNAKVQAVADRANAWDLGTSGNDCIKKLAVCKAEKLTTAY